MSTKNCPPASLTMCKHCSLHCRRIRQLPDGVPTYTLIGLMSDGRFDRNNLIHFGICLGSSLGERISGTLVY